jgi:Ca2+-transporting ATPase
VVFGIFEWELQSGAPEAEARTAAVAAIVFGQLFYLFNCRSPSRSFIAVGIFSNIWVWVGAASMAVFQLLFIYAPEFNRIFHSRPIGARAWAFVLAGGLAVSLVVGIEKGIRRRIESRRASGREA